MNDTRIDTRLSPVQVFISYSHRDAKYAERLIEHLALLKQQGHIEQWIDGKMSAGQEFDQAIKAALDSSEIILLLVTPSFIASNYCYNIEMKQALTRHTACTARVIPIIVKPVEGWQQAPFGHLKALPKDGKAVTSRRDWPSQGEAWVDVVCGIRAAVGKLAELRRDAEIRITTVGSASAANPPGEGGEYVAQGAEGAALSTERLPVSEATAVLRSLSQTREFEVLDVAWKELQIATSAVANLTRTGVVSIPDFRNMSDKLLRTHLDARHFNQDDRDAVLSQDPPNREREYLRRARWYDFHAAEISVAELNNHLLEHKIFLTAELTTSFHALVLKLRYALNKYLTGLQVIQQGGDIEGHQMLRGAYEEAFPMADKARSQIKQLIQERLRLRG